MRDDPASAEALYGLGSVYLKQEKTTEARESFERATRLPASYPDTLANSWNNLGLLATREGRTAEAIPYFQEALRLNPDHLVALDNLGNAYRQQKNWEEARKTLERALKVNPEDPEANYSLGMVFAQLDDSDRAYEYLQKALKSPSRLSGGVEQSGRPLPAHPAPGSKRWQVSKNAFGLRPSSISPT